MRSWIGKSRRDTHSKSVAHLLARREQGTKAAEQTYNVTTRYKERADDHVGFGNNLFSICFRRLGLLDSFTRHRHRLSCTIDALDHFSMDGVCKSVSKSVLNEFRHTAVLPSSAAPICLVASDLGPGLGAPETGALASLLTIEPVLGALGLAFVASDLSKGLGLALAVTELVLAFVVPVLSLGLGLASAVTGLVLAFVVLDLSLGLGLASAVTGPVLAFVVWPVLSLGLGLASAVTGLVLAFVVLDLSLGLGLALAVTGLVLAHEALDLAFVTLALWLAALGPEGEILLLPVVAVSIGSDSNAKLGGCKCTSRYVK